MNSQEESQTHISSSLNWCRQDLLRATGLYPLSNNANKILKIVHNTYSALCLLFSATLVLGQYVFLCSRSDILRNILGSTSNTIAFTMVLTKIVLFRCRAEKHIRVEIMLQNYLKSTYLRGNGRSFNIIMRETEKSITRITLVSCAFTFLTNVSFAISPVVNDYVNGSEMCTQMPMKVWLPFELNTWRRRVTVYAIEWLVISYYCLSMSAIVNFYIYVLSLLSAEFKILKINFKSFTNGVRGDILHVFDMGHDMLVSSRLKRNVDNHQELLGMCKQVSDIMSPILIVSVAAETFVICFSGFEVCLGPFRNLQHVFTLLIALFHVFVYFWCCFKVTLHSREVSEAAYCSEWWKLPRKYRTSLLIVMIRANKPVVFRASKFCSMSLDNFVTLLKTSYSYFTLLQTLNAATGLGKK